MRLVIAIQFSDELRNSLLRLQNDLIRRGVRGNYTAPENLHLTLAFIGEYPNPDDVLDAMASVSFRSFPLSLDGFGSFGSLWWIGLRQSEALASAAHRVRHALADAGIPYDRKRFSPHITLIRKAVFNNREKFPSLLIPEVSMMADRISLMRSDRGKHGMIYTELGFIEGLPE